MVQHPSGHFDMENDDSPIDDICQPYFQVSDFPLFYIYIYIYICIYIINKYIYIYICIYIYNK